MGDEYTQKFKLEVEVEIAKAKQDLLELEKQLDKTSMGKLVEQVQRLKAEFDDLGSDVKSKIKDINSQLGKYSLSYIRQEINDIKKSVTDACSTITSAVEKMKPTLNIGDSLNIGGMTDEMAGQFAELVTSIKQINSKLSKEGITISTKGLDEAAKKSESDVKIIEAAEERLKNAVKKIINVQSQLTEILGSSKEDIGKKNKDDLTELRGFISEVLDASKELEGLGGNVNNILLKGTGKRERNRLDRTALNQIYRAINSELATQRSNGEYDIKKTVSIDYTVSTKQSIEDLYDQIVKNVIGGVQDRLIKGKSAIRIPIGYTALVDDSDVKTQEEQIEKLKESSAVKYLTVQVKQNEFSLKNQIEELVGKVNRQLSSDLSFKVPIIGVVDEDSVIGKTEEIVSDLLSETDVESLDKKIRAKMSGMSFDGKMEVDSESISAIRNILEKWDGSGLPGMETTEEFKQEQVQKRVDASLEALASSAITRAAKFYGKTAKTRPHDYSKDPYAREGHFTDWDRANELISEKASLDDKKRRVRELSRNSDIKNDLDVMRQSDLYLSPKEFMHLAGYYVSKYVKNDDGTVVLKTAEEQYRQELEDAVFLKAQDVKGLTKEFEKLEEERKSGGLDAEKTKRYDELFEMLSMRGFSDRKFYKKNQNGKLEEITIKGIFSSMNAFLKKDGERVLKDLESLRPEYGIVYDKKTNTIKDNRPKTEAEMPKFEIERASADYKYRIAKLQEQENELYAQNKVLEEFLDLSAKRKSGEEVDLDKLAELSSTISSYKNISGQTEYLTTVSEYVELTRKQKEEYDPQRAVEITAKAKLMESQLKDIESKAILVEQLESEYEALDIKFRSGHLTSPKEIERYRKIIPEELERLYESVTSPIDYAVAMTTKRSDGNSLISNMIESIESAKKKVVTSFKMMFEQMTYSPSAKEAIANENPLMAIFGDDKKKDPGKYVATYTKKEYQEALKIKEEATRRLNELGVFTPEVASGIKYKDKKNNTRIATVDTRGLEKYEIDEIRQLKYQLESANKVVNSYKTLHDVIGDDETIAEDVVDWNLIGLNISDELKQKLSKFINFEKPGSMFGDLKNKPEEYLNELRSILDQVLSEYASKYMELSIADFDDSLQNYISEINEISGEEGVGKGLSERISIAIGNINNRMEEIVNETISLANLSEKDPEYSKKNNKIEALNIEYEKLELLKSVIEDSVRKKTERVLQGRVSFTDIGDTYGQQVNDTVNLLINRYISSLNETITSLDGELRNIERLFSEGKITESKYKSQKKDLELHIAAIKNTINKFNNREEWEKTLKYSLGGFSSLDEIQAVKDAYIRMKNYNESEVQNSQNVKAYEKSMEEFISIDSYMQDKINEVISSKFKFATGIDLRGFDVSQASGKNFEEKLQNFINEGLIQQLEDSKNSLYQYIELNKNSLTETDRKGINDEIRSIEGNIEKIKNQNVRYIKNLINEAIGKSKNSFGINNIDDFIGKRSELIRTMNEYVPSVVKSMSENAISMLRRDIKRYDNEDPNSLGYRQIQKKQIEEDYEKYVKEINENTSYSDSTKNDKIRQYRAYSDSRLARIDVIFDRYVSEYEGKIKLIEEMKAVDSTQIESKISELESIEERAKEFLRYNTPDIYSAIYKYKAFEIAAINMLGLQSRSIKQLVDGRMSERIEFSPDAWFESILSGRNTIAGIENDKEQKNAKRVSGNNVEETFNVGNDAESTTSDYYEKLIADSKARQEDIRKKREEAEKTRSQRAKEADELVIKAIEDKRDADEEFIKYLSTYSLDAELYNDIINRHNRENEDGIPINYSLKEIQHSKSDVSKRRNVIFKTRNEIDSIIGENGILDVYYKAMDELESSRKKFDMYLKELDELNSSKSNDAQVESRKKILTSSIVSLEEYIQKLEIEIGRRFSGFNEDAMYDRVDELERDLDRMLKGLDESEQQLATRQKNRRKPTNREEALLAEKEDLEKYIAYMQQSIDNPGSGFVRSLNANSILATLMSQFVDEKGNGLFGNDFEIINNKITSGESLTQQEEELFAFYYQRLIYMLTSGNKTLFEGYIQDLMASEQKERLSAIKLSENGMSLEDSEFVSLYQSAVNTIFERIGSFGILYREAIERLKVIDDQLVKINLQQERKMNQEAKSYMPSYNKWTSRARKDVSDSAEKKKAADTALRAAEERRKAIDEEEAMYSEQLAAEQSVERSITSAYALERQKRSGDFSLGGATFEERNAKLAELEKQKKETLGIIDALNSKLSEIQNQASLSESDKKNYQSMQLDSMLLSSGLNDSDKSILKTFISNNGIEGFVSAFDKFAKANNFLENRNYNKTEYDLINRLLPLLDNKKNNRNEIMSIVKQLGSGYEELAKTKKMSGLRTYAEERLSSIGKYFDVEKFNEATKDMSENQQIIDIVSMLEENIKKIFSDLTMSRGRHILAPTKEKKAKYQEEINVFTSELYESLSLYSRINPGRSLNSILGIDLLMEKLKKAKEINDEGAEKEIQNKLAQFMIGFSTFSPLGVNQEKAIRYMQDATFREFNDSNSNIARNINAAGMLSAITTNKTKVNEQSDLMKYLKKQYENGDWFTGTVLGSNIVSAIKETEAYNLKKLLSDNAEYLLKLIRPNGLEGLSGDALTKALEDVSVHAKEIISDLTASVKLMDEEILTIQTENAKDTGFVAYKSKKISEFQSGMTKVQKTASTMVDQKIAEILSEYKLYFDAQKNGDAASQMLHKLKIGELRDDLKSRQAAAEKSGLAISNVTGRAYSTKAASKIESRRNEFLPFINNIIEEQYVENEKRLAELEEKKASEIAGSGTDEAVKKEITKKYDDLISAAREKSKELYDTMFFVKFNPSDSNPTDFKAFGAFVKKTKEKLIKRTEGIYIPTEEEIKRNRQYYQEREEKAMKSYVNSRHAGVIINGSRINTTIGNLDKAHRTAGMTEEQARLALQIAEQVTAYNNANEVTPGQDDYMKSLYREAAIIGLTVDKPGKGKRYGYIKPMVSKKAFLENWEGYDSNSYTHEALFGKKEGNFINIDRIANTSGLALDTTLQSILNVVSKGKYGYITYTKKPVDPYEKKIESLKYQKNKSLNEAFYEAKRGLKEKGATPDSIDAALKKAIQAGLYVGKNKKTGEYYVKRKNPDANESAITAELAKKFGISDVSQLKNGKKAAPKKTDEDKKKEKETKNANKPYVAEMKRLNKIINSVEATSEEREKALKEGINKGYIVRKNNSENARYGYYLGRSYSASVSDIDFTDQIAKVFGVKSGVKLRGAENVVNPNPNKKKTYADFLEVSKQMRGNFADTRRLQQAKDIYRNSISSLLFNEDEELTNAQLNEVLRDAVSHGYSIHKTNKNKYGYNVVGSRSKELTDEDVSLTKQFTEKGNGVVKWREEAEAIVETVKEEVVAENESLKAINSQISALEEKKKSLEGIKAAISGADNDTMNSEIDKLSSQISKLQKNKRKIETEDILDLLNKRAAASNKLNDAKKNLKAKNNTITQNAMLDAQAELDRIQEELLIKGYGKSENGFSASLARKQYHDYINGTIEKPAPMGQSELENLADDNAIKKRKQVLETTRKVLELKIAEIMESEDPTNASRLVELTKALNDVFKEFDEIDKKVKERAEKTTETAKEVADVVNNGSAKENPALPSVVSFDDYKKNLKKEYLKSIADMGKQIEQMSKVFRLIYDRNSSSMDPETQNVLNELQAKTEKIKESIRTATENYIVDLISPFSKDINSLSVSFGKAKNNTDRSSINDRLRMYLGDLVDRIIPTETEAAKLIKNDDGTAIPNLINRFMDNSVPEYINSLLETIKANPKAANVDFSSIESYIVESIRKEISLSINGKQGHFGAGLSDRIFDIIFKDSLLNGIKFTPTDTIKINNQIIVGLTDIIRNFFSKNDLINSSISTFISDTVSGNENYGIRSADKLREWAKKSGISKNMGKRGKLSGNSKNDLLLAKQAVEAGYMAYYNEAKNTFGFYEPSAKNRTPEQVLNARRADDELKLRLGQEINSTWEDKLNDPVFQKSIQTANQTSRAVKEEKTVVDGAASSFDTLADAKNRAADANEREAKTAKKTAKAIKEETDAADEFALALIGLTGSSSDKPDTSGKIRKVSYDGDSTRKLYELNYGRLYKEEVDNNGEIIKSSIVTDYKEVEKVVADNISEIYKLKTKLEKAEFDGKSSLVEEIKSQLERRQKFGMALFNMAKEYMSENGSEYTFGEFINNVAMLTSDIRLSEDLKMAEIQDKKSKKSKDKKDKESAQKKRARTMWFKKLHEGSLTLDINAEENALSQSVYDEINLLKKDINSLEEEYDAVDGKITDELLKKKMSIERKMSKLLFDTKGKQSSPSDKYDTKKNSWFSKLTEKSYKLDLLPDDGALTIEAEDEIKSIKDNLSKLEEEYDAADGVVTEGLTKKKMELDKKISDFLRRSDIYYDDVVAEKAKKKNSWFSKLTEKSYKLDILQEAEKLKPAAQSELEGLKDEIETLKASYDEADGEITDDLIKKKMKLDKKIFDFLNRSDIYEDNVVAEKTEKKNSWLNKLQTGLYNAENLKESGLITEFASKEIDKITSEVKNLKSKYEEANGVINEDLAKEKLSLEKRLSDLLKDKNIYTENNNGIMGNIVGTDISGVSATSFQDAMNKVYAAYRSKAKNDGDVSISSFNEKQGTFNVLVKTGAKELTEYSYSFDKLNNSVRGVKKSTKGISTLFESITNALSKSRLLGQLQYALGSYSMMMKFVNCLKQGVQYLQQFDSALTTISYTMDLTSTQLDKVGESVIEMAKNLSTSIENASSMYQIFANMNTTAADIEAMVKPTAILANLSKVDASTASDQIQGIIQQFSMLEDEENSLAETSMHVVDVLDKISANVSIDYAKGISVITEAVTATGQVASDAGMSYEELAAVTAKIAERTREDGSSIGNAMKTMFTRISKVASMSEYGDEIDNDSVSKAAQALHQIGIEVYDADGNFNNITDTLTKLNEKWGTLTDAQKSYISYQIAATRQSSKFKSMLEAWTDGMRLAAEATDASGNALANQEKYEESFSGKIQKIQTEWQAFLLTIENSDVFKDVLDVVIELLDVLDKFATKNPTSSLTGMFTAFAIPPFLIALIRDLSSGKLQKTFEIFKANKKINTKNSESAAYDSETAAIDRNTLARQKNEAQKELDAAQSKVRMFEEAEASGIVITSEMKEAAANQLDAAQKKFNKIESDELAASERKLKTSVDTTTASMTAEGIAAESMLGAIGIAIGLITTALSLLYDYGNREGWFDSVDDALESSSAIIESYRENLNSVLSEKDNLDELAEKYTKLSKHVDQFGNNIDLTSSSFSEYNDLVNGIAEKFPTLISGYTETGNAIINMKDAVNDLNAAYDESVLDGYKQLISGTSGENDNLSDIIKNYNKAMNGNWIVELFNGIEGVGAGEILEDYKNLDEAIRGMVNLDKETEGMYSKILSSVDLYNVSDFEAVYSRYYENYEIFGGDKSDYNDEVNASIVFYEELTKEQQKLATKYINALTSSNSTTSIYALLKKYGYNNFQEMELGFGNLSNLENLLPMLASEIASAQKKVDSNVNSMKEGVNALYHVFTSKGQKYENITDIQKSFVESMISSIDSSVADTFTDPKTMSDWIDNLLSFITEAEPTVQAAVYSLFSIDFSKETVFDSVKWIDSYVDAILDEAKKKYGEGSDEYKKFKKMLYDSVGYNDLVEQKELYENRIKSIVSASFGGEKYNAANQAMLAEYVKIGEFLDTLTKDQQEYWFEATEGATSYESMMSAYYKKMEEVKKKQNSINDFLSNTSGINIDGMFDHSSKQSDSEETPTWAESIDQYNSRIDTLKGYIDTINNEGLSDELRLEIATNFELDTSGTEQDVLGQLEDTMDNVEDVIVTALENAINDESNAEIKAYLTGILNDIKQINSEAKKMQNSFNLTGDPLSDTQRLTEGLDKLGEIYVDVYDAIQKDGKNFDWSSIINNSDFDDMFKPYTDEYNDFIDTITNNSTDIKKCQDSFNNLATAYVYGSEALDTVTEKERTATIAMLKQAGVRNAEAVVDSKITLNKIKNNKELMNSLKNVTEETKDQVTEQLKLAGATNAELVVSRELDVKSRQLELNRKLEKKGIDDLNDATYEEIMKRATDIGLIVTEDGKIDDVEASMFELIAREKILANNDLGVDQKIADLQSLALAYGKTAKAAEIAAMADRQAMSESAIQTKTLQLVQDRNSKFFGNYELAKAEAERQIGSLYSESSMNTWMSDMIDNMFDGENETVEIEVTTDIDFLPEDKIKDINDSMSDKIGNMDWIEILISRIEREITNLGNVASGTWRTWEERTKSLGAEMGKVTDEIAVQTAAAQKYMEAANGVALSEEYKALVRSGALRIDTILDDDLKNAIEKYQELYEKSLSCTDKAEELRDTLAEIAQTKFDNLIKQFDEIISRIDHVSTMIDKFITNVETNNGIAGKSFYQAQIDQNSKKLDQTRSKKNSAMDSLAESVANGSIIKGSEQYNTMLESILALDEEEQDLINTNDELANKMKEVIKLDFEDLKSQFDSIMDFIDARMGMTNSIVDLITTSGHLASASYYESIGEDLKRQKSIAESSLDTLSKKIEEGLENGDFEIGDETWLELNNSLIEEGNKVVELTKSEIENNKAIRELNDTIKQYAQDRRQFVVDEASWMSDILSHFENQLYEDNGQLTDKGRANQGLAVENYLMSLEQYNAASAKASQKYADWQADTSNVDLYKEYVDAKKEEQDYLNSAYGYWDKIVSIEQEQLNRFKEYVSEAITKYTEMLDTQKDLYDYQKQIQEKADNINSLKRQLMVYSGDDSEEGRAEFWKLEKQLADAEEELQQTEYDRYISDQKAMLQNFSDELDEWIENRMDKVEELLNNAITAVNENKNGISQTIKDEFGALDYVKSEENTAIWGTEGSQTTIQKAIQTASESIASWSNGLPKDLAASFPDVSDTLKTYFGEGTDIYDYIKDSGYYANQIHSKVEEYEDPYNEQTLIDQLDKLIEEKKALFSPTVNVDVKVDGSGNVVTDTKLDNPTVNEHDGEWYCSKCGKYHKNGTECPNKDEVPEETVEESDYSKKVFYITDSSTGKITDYTYDPSKAKTLEQKVSNSVGMLKIGDKTFTKPSEYSAWLHEHEDELRKASKYYVGAHNLKRDEIAWTQEYGEEAILSPTTGAVLTPLKAGDSVLTAAETENLYNIAKMSPSQLMSRGSFMSVNIPESNSGYNNVSVGDTSVTLNLPNITTKDEFVTWLKTDRTITKVIQEATIGQALGHNSYSKMKY